MNQELAIRKAEVKIKDREQVYQMVNKALDIAGNIILNPAFDYVALVLLLEYLSTHPENNFEFFGIPIGGKGAIITKDTAKIVTGGLTAALAANAFGGGQGIAAMIKAVK